MRPAPELQGQLPLADTARGVLLALVDRDARIAYANPICEELLGFPPRELIDRPAADLVPEPLRRQAIEAFVSARRGEPHLGQDTILRGADGADVPLRVDATPVTSGDGEVEYVALSVQQRRDGVAPPGHPSAPSPADAAALVRRIPAVVYHAAPGAQGRWHYVSPQIEGMLGYSAAEWTADPNLWASCIHPGDRDRVLDEEGRDIPDPAPVGSEYRMLTRDGQTIWVRDEAVVHAEPDGSVSYWGLLIDITERKQLEAQLLYDAEHDELTGVWNRRRFLAELETELRRVRRFHEPASLLMIDIDDLKRVNDELGHPVGDGLICGVTEVLAGRLRDSDTIARIGGDEFAVLLRGTALDQAHELAKELAEAIGARAALLSRGVASSGVSIGVIELRSHFRRVADVLAEADSAMYEAKRAGGGTAAKR